MGYSINYIPQQIPERDYTPPILRSCGKMNKDLDIKEIKERMSGGYSVCFNEWALDKRIRTELPLLMIISSLSAESGICFASNKYLSKLFNCTEISISQKINKLRKFGYIEIEYEKRGCEITKRFIRLKKFLTDDYKKIKPSSKKSFKDNNISNNNISNNINPQPLTREEVGITSIISYFNQCKIEDVRRSEINRVVRWMNKNDLDIEYVIKILKYWINNKNDTDYAPQISTVGEMMVKFNGLVRFYDNNGYE